MLRNDQLVCDSCQTVISRITEIPAAGWDRMHNLCSRCFLALWQTSPQR